MNWSAPRRPRGDFPSSNPKALQTLSLDTPTIPVESREVIGKHEWTVSEGSLVTEDGFRHIRAAFRRASAGTDPVNGEMRPVRSRGSRPNIERKKLPTRQL